MNINALAQQIADYFKKNPQQMTDTPSSTPAPAPATATPAPATTPSSTPAPAPKKDKKKATVAEATVAPQGGGGAAGWKFFKAGDAALGASGKGATPVNKAGKLAYEALYKKGKIHGGGSSLNLDIIPKEFFPAEQLRFSFKIMYDDNFPWDPPREKVGGKIIGFFIGKGSASGGNYTKTAASFRLTWSFNGGVGPYLYPQVKNPFSKGGSGKPDIPKEDLDQSQEVWDVSYVAAGMHVFFPKKKEDPNAWELKFKKGQWNDVEMFIKLNTPGKKDGLLSLTVNGVTKSLKTVRFRNDNAKIERVEIATFFGGGTQDYAPPADTKAWYADFGFSKA